MTISRLGVGFSGREGLSGHLWEGRDGMKPMDALEIEARFGETLPVIRAMGRMTFDPIWAQKDHLSAGIEVLHVLKGEMELILDGGPFRAGRGNTLLVPPGVWHRDAFDPVRGLDVFFGSLSWALSGEYFSIVNNRVLDAMSARAKAGLSALFGQLREDLEGPEPADRLVARARLHTILLVILREALRPRHREPSGPDEAYGALRRRELMDGARGYIEKHYGECVALEEVAGALDVSPYYLSHVFSRESDFSLFAYLTSVRMEKARELLREGRLQVAEVGRAVGYEDPNYFSKAFRKHVGCPPRAFAASQLSRRKSAKKS